MRRKMINLLRSPAFVYLVAGALSRVGALVLIPLYTRALSREDYGDYALALSIVAICPTLLTLGLTSSIPRAFFGQSDREQATRQAGDVAACAIVCAFGMAFVVYGLTTLIPGV